LRYVMLLWMGWHGMQITDDAQALSAKHSHNMQPCLLKPAGKHAE